MMKNLHFLLLFLLLAGVNSFSFSQYTPKGMSYQAVARDESGFELKSKLLEVKISIIAEDPSGISEYCESHSVSTDKYGLFSLIIGQGSYVSGAAGDFSQINWGSGVHYMKVEVDFGSGFRSMGTTQFLAVPYALYAGTASNVPDSNDYQQISYDPLVMELELQNGGKVDLSGLYHDPDYDPINEIQNLSYKNQVLSLDKGGNSVTLDVNDADANPNNELQSLSLNGYQLTISSGNSVTLTDKFEDADHDSINEIQDLHFEEQSNILTVTKNPDAYPVNLSKYLDNKDEQTLAVSGDSLAIIRGNKIPMDVSKTNEIQTLRRSASGDSILLSLNGGYVIDKFDDADNNPSNELQSIRLTGDNLSLTNDPSAGTVSLNKYLDDTDDQTLSRNGYNLSISNGNSIDIRPNIIAFRTLKSVESSKILYANDSTILVFPTEKLDSANCFNTLTGQFVVPPGGAGLYHFDLNYQYSTGHSLKIIVNGAIYEKIPLGQNYTFLLYLNQGETVEIQLNSSVLSNPSSGSFSGYRIH